MKHNDSKEHRHAVEADSMSKQIFRTDDISTVPVEVNRNVSTSAMNLFRTVYFVASEVVLLQM